MKIVYSVRVLRDGLWKHAGTYWNRGIAERAVSDILKSSAKKWMGVEGVRLSQRPWVNEETVQEWAKGAS